MIVEKKKITRSLTGNVVSNRMDKTIKVSIVTKIPHPKYGKYIKRVTNVLAHDPDNHCKIGDRVLVRACRPISKNKHWVLYQVLEGVQTNSFSQSMGDKNSNGVSP
jgi:small subunit ribosomal protein S17